MGLPPSSSIAFSVEFLPCYGVILPYTRPSSGSLHCAREAFGQHLSVQEVSRSLWMLLIAAVIFWVESKSTLAALGLVKLSMLHF